MANSYSQTWFELFLETQLYTEYEVTFIARNLPGPDYRRILDVCCGPGRHSRPLAARGYEVVGIDLDETALARARRETAGNATNEPRLLSPVMKSNSGLEQYHV